MFTQGIQSALIFDKVAVRLRRMFFVGESVADASLDRFEGKLDIIVAESVSTLMKSRAAELDSPISSRERNKASPFKLQLWELLIV